METDFNRFKRCVEKWDKKVREGASYAQAHLDASQIGIMSSMINLVQLVDQIDEKVHTVEPPATMNPEWDRIVTIVRDLGFSGDPDDDYV